MVLIFNALISYISFRFLDARTFWRAFSSFWAAASFAGANSKAETSKNKTDSLVNFIKHPFIQCIVYSEQ
ncbi:MAG: hypothetical protein ACD_47C00283G0002 [uncultured bacterium]|nr:MAG: hypothetical protein ACD_47C00283G0002 [uncultured bacterium]